MKKCLWRSFALLLVAPVVMMALPTIASANSAHDYMAVTFFQNDNVQDSVSAPQYEEALTPLTLFANLDFSNPGHIFNDWNTTADGSSAGTIFTDGEEFGFGSNLTLYAQWTVASISTNSTITFDANGGSGSILPITDPNGTILAMPSAAGLTNQGFSFAGWNTSASGTGGSYSNSGLLDVTSSLTLYAQWVKTSAITISFAANGGVGTVDSLSGVSGVSVTLPGGTGLSYAGHTFASWNTVADGSGTVLDIDAPLLLGNSLTLYAQWDPLLVTKPTTVLIGAVGAFANNSSKLTTNLRTQIHRLAALTKSGHFAAEVLYGYTSATGTLSSQRTISSRRASVVAQYLRLQLATLHVAGVKVTSSGEGALKAQSGASSRRVEVFVKG